jgi:hypothetical protein
MLLPAEYRQGWIKFPFAGLGSDDAQVRSTEPFKEGMKGRLYFRSPHLRPGAVDAVVWRIDRDGVVFQFTGPTIPAPPLDTIPSVRRVHLSALWLWTWESLQL